MTDLSTTYLGCQLKNPLIAAASPLTDTTASIQQLEAAGAGAVVIHSLLTEEVSLQNVTPPATTAVSHKFIPNHPGAYLAFLTHLKQTVTIPTIANLSGRPQPDWPDYARQLAETGVDALEINVAYVNTDPAVTGEDVEAELITLAKNLKAAVDIPIAFKISPYFSALSNVVTALERAGIDGLVIFNRYFEPDFDIETKMLTKDLELSQAEELRLRLRWAAILSRYLKNTDLAITGGVQTGEDVLKAIMTGAQAVMMASALLTNGVNHITAVRDHLAELLTTLDMPNLQSVHGLMSQDKIRNPAAYERANYMRVLKSY